MYLNFFFSLCDPQKNDEDDYEEGLVGELELEEEVMGDEEPEDVALVSGGGGHHDRLEATDDLQQLRQRKDELTQKHLDEQRRKQQLKVKIK